jgi:hypothetical protein
MKMNKLSVAASLLLLSNTVQSATDTGSSIQSVPSSFVYDDTLGYSANFTNPIHIRNFAEGYSPAVYTNVANLLGQAFGHTFVGDTPSWNGPYDNTVFVVEMNAGVDIWDGASFAYIANGSTVTPCINVTWTGIDTSPVKVSSITG